MTDALDEEAPPPVLTKLRSKPHTLGMATVPSHHLSREEKRAAALVVYPTDVQRPRTRGECKDAPRPCPWVSCKWHLYLDVNEVTGSLKLNQVEREPWELEETCALDVADRGGVTLEEAGEFLGVTRERVRQIEEQARRRVMRAASVLEAA
jgi:hypothetical protein